MKRKLFAIGLLSLAYPLSEINAAVDPDFDLLGIDLDDDDIPEFYIPAGQTRDNFTEAFTHAYGNFYYSYYEEAKIDELNDDAGDLKKAAEAAAEKDATDKAAQAAAEAAEAARVAAEKNTLIGFNNKTQNNNNILDPNTGESYNNLVNDGKFLTQKIDLDNYKLQISNSIATKAFNMLNGSVMNASGNMVFEDLFSLSGENTTANFTGNATFDKRVTVDMGSTLNFGTQSNPVTVTLKDTLEVKSGSFLSISDSSTLTGNIKLKEGSKIQMGSGIFVGAMEFKKSLGDFTGSNLQGVVFSDPSVLFFGGTTSISPTPGIADSGKLVLGNHDANHPDSPNDSYNALLFRPGAKLNVTKLVLNNKNALLVGYDPKKITPQEATDLINAGSMIGGNADDLGKFDYVFTYDLDENDKSDGILQPIDATVTNNDGTYKFNVEQSTTGVKLSIDANGVEPSVGSDMTNIIATLRAQNPEFAKLAYDPGSAGYSVRTTNIANTLISAVETAKNSLSGVNTDHVNEFRGKFAFKPTGFARNQKTTDRAESIMKALADSTPINLKTNEYRLWVSPFSNNGNTVGNDASRDWLIGALVGAEYRDLKKQYAIGLIGGANFGHAFSKKENKNETDIKGINFGSYGSYGAWEGGRVDFVYLRSINDLKESRLTAQNGVAKNDHKLTVDLLDTQTSHLFKIPGDIWSVRFNVGHTYTHSEGKGYTETSANWQNQAKSTQYGHVSEIYGGIGTRWNYRGETWRARITGVYEYGAEYVNKNSLVKTSHGSALNIHSFNRDKSAKARNHYLTLYTTLNNKTGFKLYAGYSGTLSKNSVDTTFTVKGEYRW